MKVVREVFDQAAKLYRETKVFTLPNGNGDAGEPMMSESKEKIESAPKKSMKRKIVKPKNHSLLDFTSRMVGFGLRANCVSFAFSQC